MGSTILEAGGNRPELVAFNLEALQLRRGQHVHALGARPDHVNLGLELVGGGRSAFAVQSFNGQSLDKVFIHSLFPKR